MERLMKLAEEQARVKEALVGWVARNASLHGAVAVVVNPSGRWGSQPTWRGG